MSDLKFYFKFLLVLLGIILIGTFILPEKLGFFSFVPQKILAHKQNELTLLLIGKPGEGYIGGENTDSLIIVHLILNDQPKIYLIPIPRDLIVFDKNNNLTKINQLYALKELDTLLQKASDYSGLEIKNYFVYDLHFILGLAEVLGGIEVKLDQPVIDAVSFYTIYPGKRILKGDDLELVLRSRYYPDGDFQRIKNQLAVIEGFKNKFLNLSWSDKIKILKFVLTNRKNWQTNLNQETIYFLLNKSQEFKEAQIKVILLTTKEQFLKSGYFTLGNSEGVYGIYPSLGIDDYNHIKNYILAELKNN